MFMMQYNLNSVLVVCHVVSGIQSTLNTCFLVPCQDMSQGMHQIVNYAYIPIYL